jgi:hypothetical protein
MRNRLGVALATFGLIVANRNHLVIAGRDRFLGKEQTEFGTHNAVCTFVEKYLGVRRLWPGELGEDIVRRGTISFAPFEYRFRPPFRRRFMRYPRFVTSARQVHDWWRFHRCDTRGARTGSLEWAHGYVSDGWWERYHADHPEYFGLLPDGTRSRWRGKVVKLCVSSPEVASQWLGGAEERLREHPLQAMVSAAPSDSGGWCVCKRCRAMDHPDGPPSNYYGEPYVMLTDRYVKFWNALARGLRRRFPNREVLLNTLAYSRYSSPPVGEALENNIVIAHVGHFPLTTEAHREKQKREYREWADKASVMMYRPNFFYWCGGIWGMPEVAMRKTIEDFRFLAENKCVGLDIDSVHLNFATLGPQLYLMACLAYDPLQDGDALLRDYYRRGFGPAAGQIETYFGMMEAARKAIVESPDYRLGGSFVRRGLLDLFVRVYDEAFFERASGLLRRARERTAKGSARYRRRVDFVRDGLAFTRLMVQIIPAMKRVRESGGADAEAVKQAAGLYASRKKLYGEAAPFALDPKRIAYQIRARIGPDYFGPPSERFLKAAQKAGSGAGKAARPTLAPARWKLAFSDDFERDELGDAWKVVRGRWTVENGWLVSGGGILVSGKSFPGLQRVEFRATTNLRAGTQCSDISPFIHASEEGIRSGYFLQFGGQNNTRNTLRRLGSVVREDRAHKIVPGKVHALAAEFDGRRVRLSVDGSIVMEYEERDPLLGKGHDRAGFYLFTPARIDDVKVYTSEARKARAVQYDPDAD